MNSITSIEGDLCLPIRDTSDDKVILRGTVRSWLELLRPPKSA